MNPNELPQNNSPQPSAAVPPTPMPAAPPAPTPSVAPVAPSPIAAPAPLAAYPTETYQPAAAPEAPEASVQPAAPQAAPELPPDVPVQWVAQEYIHLDKGMGWYAAFAAITLALIAVDIFFLKSWTFSVLVVVMAVALMVYTRRPPRDIQYSLSARQGLYIGEKLYHLADFKAFGLVKDDGQNAIMLIPIKRFAPTVSVYFPEEAGEQIVDILGQRLPMEQVKLDAVDVIVRKLRM